MYVCSYWSFEPYDDADFRPLTVMEAASMTPVADFTKIPAIPDNVPLIRPMPPYYSNPYLGLLYNPTTPLLTLENKLFDPCLMPLAIPFCWFIYI